MERKIVINIDSSNVIENDVNIKETIKKFSESFDNIKRTYNEQIIESFKQVGEALKSLVESIDFSTLSETQQKHIENIMNMLDSGWKKGWYLPDELIDCLLDRYETLLEPYSFGEDIVINYFEKHFESLSNKAINHPFYNNHKELLIESRELYNEKRFAISAYPLFSAVDNLFTRWIKNPNRIEIDNNTGYIPAKRKDELKVSKENFNPVQTLDMSNIMIYSAYQAYLYYFDSCSNRQILNRNTYMHGNYEYSSMGKIQCLKLWSTLILFIECIELERI